MNSRRFNNQLAPWIFLGLTLFLLISANSISALVNYTDNSVDSDSSVDSSNNIGNSGSTSYLDAQAIGGSDEVISEENIGNRDQYSFWSNYKNIIIDHNKVSADLTNFPVFISLIDENLKTTAQTDGDDIAFFDQTGTQLSHEFEIYNSSYSGTQAQLLAWVQANLSSSQDTIITMKYGNSTMPSQQDPTGVWGTEYKGVWHLDETPSGAVDELIDSTTNDNDGYTDGMNSGNLVQTNLGNGLDFDGIDDFVVFNDSLSLDSVNDEGTISLWINWVNSSNGDYQKIMASSNRFTSNDGFELGVQPDGDLFFYPWGGDSLNYNLATNPFTNNQWQYLSVTWNYGTSTVDIHLNGVELAYAVENVDTRWTTLATLDDWLWGTDVPYYNLFNGKIDEIRVMDTNKSPQWFQTEFNNQNSPSSFYTVTDESTYDAPYWTNYKDIIIDDTKVAGDLVDFPVYIHLIDENLKELAQTDGDDIAFFDSSGTQLAHEIETYDPNYSGTQAQLIAWVKADIFGSADTRITMKYGNSTMPSQQNPTGVWDTNFAGVWHMNNDPSSSSILDSTSNNNDGTHLGSMDSSDLVTGKTGSAIEFDGTDDYISLGNPASLQITGPLTLETWFKASTDIANDYLVTKSNGSGDRGWDLSFDTGTGTSGYVMFRYTDSNSNPHSEGYESIDIDNWYHIAGVFEPSTAQRFYLNGILVSENTTGVPAALRDATVNALFARRSGSAEYYEGLLDEIRISNTARSTNWITTEYNNQNSPSTFYTVTSQRSLVTEDLMDNPGSNVDNAGNIGSNSNFGDMQTKDGVFNTLQENTGFTNSYGLDTSGSVRILVGDGTVSWGGESQGTISYWVKFYDFAKTYRPWGLNDNFEFRTSGTTLLADFGADAQASSYPLTANVWYFVAIVWNENNDTLKLYVGNNTNYPSLVDINTAWTVTVSDKPVTEHNFMASRGVDRVNGIGDELRFWEIDRTVYDLQSDYNRTIAGSERYLRSYFQLENNFQDSGPDANHGSANSTDYSFLFDTPSYLQGDSKLDIEVQWTNVPSLDVSREIGIYAGATDSEDLKVDYWNGSDWVNIISDISANSWTNISIESFITSSTFTIRFRDGENGLYPSDTTQNSWQIDMVVIRVVNYRLDWEHQVQSLDTSREFYELTIYGQASSTDDSFNIHLWNQSSSSWEPLLGIITNSLQWYNFSISGTGIINPTVTWKYNDTNNFKDAIKDDLTIVYAGIASYDLAPVFTDTPNDIQYAEGETGNSLSWTATDDNAGSYTIYRNGTSIDSGAWSSSTPISINVDGLSKAVYNYTIVISDTFSTQTKDTAFVTVIDNTNPTIDLAQNDFSMIEGTTGNWVNWSVSDLYPDNYIIYRNGSQVATGTWSSGVNITYNIDSDQLNIYNYTLVAFDDSGNSISDTVIVTVYDTTNPNLQSPVSDITYDEGTTGNTIDWTAEDNHADYYILYKDDVQIDTNSWTFGVPISINIDGLVLGTYNYTIVIFDTSNNSLTDTVIVTVEDQSPPTISEPADIQYEEGNTGNNIVWNLNDLYPANFSVYRNGTLLLSGSWTNGDITVRVDELTVGIYNYTISANDNSSNIASDLVWVTVVDTAQPLIDSPTDKSLDEGTTGNKIEWTPTDAHPDTYVIYQNGTQVDSNTWVSGSKITYNLDALTKGDYNFTIVVNDTSGNWNRDVVLVIVSDGTNPEVTSPTDIQYAEGANGNSISWTPTDTYPWRYTIYKDSVNTTYGNWISGNPITINIDGLLKGSYNYTILILDESANPVSDEVIVTVIDNTNPVVDSPSDVNYIEGSTGNSITWTATDDYPDKYRLYRNGTQVAYTGWSSGVGISRNVDGLSMGIYNYTIVVYDASGNFVKDEVLVTVTDETSPSISQPSDFSYNEGTTGNSITWDASDAHPDKMTIYRNGTVQFSSSWTSGNINFNIDGLSIGVYNYTIVLNDTSNNLVFDTVFVTVVDNTLPTISSPDDISYALDSTGNTIDWIASDVHPDNYTVYRNGTQTNSGTWISSATISIDIDGLGVGVYNYTIVVADTSNNWISDTVIVRVTSESVFLETPDDLNYIYLDTGNELSWTVSDANPDKYIIYQEGAQVDSGTWSDSVPIVWNVDGLSIGVYNFTIWVNDTDSNIVTDTAFVTVSDMPIWDPPLPSDFTYNETTTGHVILWNSTDMFPDMYSVYQNGSLFASGTWDNATYITINVDGLSIGVYNFTIVVNDTVNNQIFDTVFVTVIDTIDPSVDQPSDITYAEDSTGNTIEWNPNDLHPDTYTVYQNGSEVDSGFWSSGSPVTLNIDGLTKGPYNFTILLYDTSGNSVTDEVIVIVIDNTDPVVDSPADVTYSEGSSGNSISWTATDSYDYRYTIFENNVNVSDGAWSSGSPINYDIDGLLKGTHNITIQVFDQSGNYAVDTVIVTVTDETNPVITDNPPDSQYDEGSTGNTLSWTATDSYPDVYRIYRNGTQIISSTWSSGVAITENIDGLLKGTYNFTIIILDESGNSIFDYVEVTVIDNTPPTVTDVNDFSYFEGDTGNTIDWTPTDNYPFNYTIYQNGSSVETGSWSDGIPISYDVDNLPRGVYNFTILVHDVSENAGIDVVILTVIDNVDPTITSPADVTYIEDSTGNTITWTSSDLHPDVYYVFENGSQVDTGSWSSDVGITIDIDGLSEGVYNYTMVVYDDSGNWNSDEVVVSVNDETAPSVTTPADIQYEFGNTGNQISWTPTDNHPSRYTIFKDNVNISYGTWISGNPINQDIDGLDLGSYNYTILLLDLSNNSKTDTVIVTVVDTTDPTINSPSDINYIEGTTNNWINWTANDLNPDNYIITRNSTQIQSGSWSDGVEIAIDIDGLAKGAYLYTITIYDTSGNSISDEVTVAVTDQTIPALNSPANITYSEGDTNNKINWVASDLYPDTYDIQQDAVNVSSKQPWASGLTISYDVDGLTPGTYNYTIIVYDTSGNYNSSTVFVIVIDDTNPSINSPDDVYYVEGTTNNWINWTATDLHPKNYTIYKDSLVNRTGTWSSGVPITLDIDGLLLGAYNFTIVVEDDSGNIVADEVIVTVTDDTAPGLTSPSDSSYEEGTTGHNITWTATDVNDPGTYDLYINSVLNSSGLWNDGTPIVIDIDGLQIGNYEFEIIVFDATGNFRSDIVNILVFEVNSPIILQSANNLTYSETTTGHVVSWNVTDKYPGVYQIFQNGAQIVFDSPWNNGINITHNVDGLPKGLYNFTIIVEDSSGNSVINTVFVSVIDTTDPTVSPDTPTLTYESGSTGNTISWTAFDLHESNYSIYRNGTHIITTVWSSDTPITHNVDGLALGDYNYTIVVRDVDGHSTAETIIVTVIDTTSPSLVSSNPSDPTVYYTEGSTGNSLSWTFSDVNPSTYTITRNGTTIVPTSGWSSGVAITRIIDGLDMATYIFTITVSDTSGNTTPFTFTVIVQDETKPEFLSEPSDFSYQEGTTGHSVSWAMTDKRGEGTYELFVNGTLITTGSWVDNVEVIVNVDNLSWNVYNYTIVVKDSSNNQRTSSVFITVLDQTSPSINNGPDLDEYIEGQNGYYLNWNITDLYPASFILNQDGIEYSSGNWDNSQEIQINIDGLSFGTYNFTIFVFDQSDNSNTDWVIIDVQDLTPPVFVTVTNDLTYIEGTTGNNLEFEAFDLNPGAYILYREGVAGIPKQWSNEDPIIINIDGFDPGFYNFTIEVFDEAENSVIHTVIFRVKDPEIIDTVRPEITLNQTVYEGDVEVVTGNWTTIDGVPIADGNIIISFYLQDKVFESRQTTAIDGSFTIVFNYTGHMPGEYYWQINFVKEGYQDWSIEIEVDILPHNYKVEIKLEGTLIRGEPYYISAIVTYNNGNSSALLSLNGNYIPLTGYPEGISVYFFIEVEFFDGLGNLTKNELTSKTGVATIELTSVETSRISRLLSIRAVIEEDRGNNPISVSSNQQPIIEDPEPGFFLQLLIKLQQNIVYLGLLGAIIVGFLIFLAFRRKKEMERIRILSNSIKVAYNEIRALQSIQSIIIQTSSKLSVYEEVVTSDSVNTNLVGGMVTAFSSFLNELGRDETYGFEVMEREDVSITVHKGRFSNFIIISTQKIPVLMYPQIEDAQREIENQYRDYFTKTARGVKKLTKEQVHPLLDQASFKINLTGKLQLNHSNITDLMREQSVSRALKQNIEILKEMPESEHSEDGIFQLQDIYEFFASKDITERVTARIVMLAYQFEILEAYGGNDNE